MDLVFNLNCSVTYLDVSIVAPFSCNPSLVSAASTRPGHMAKRAEKVKFDRYPHINLVPFILETTGGPGPHARKFFNNLMRDADNLPLAISLHNNSQPPFRELGRPLSFPVSLLQTTCWHMLVPSKRERTQRFQSQANRSRAMWPCCDYTSSDDDEHNTDNNFLLLFADVDIAPALLARLSELDVLYIALGCRFALDIFTISQQYCPSPDLEPPPYDAVLEPLL